MDDEHVERQEERENEIKASVEELDQQGDQLEERGNEVEQQIGETREEWEQKQNAEDVPGAQPETELPGDDDDGEAGDDERDEGDEDQSGAPIEETE